ncbi:cold-shock protein [Lactococcus allomyrinae]|uniref:Major cold shock protein n=1 Tax=Lactococcus allomyrinae TaxID=2419773 RepID=A0A387BFU2_9LACT|nr:cold shock domain-containing protein [Lactococcus allomyrinae]AYF99846.1 cold-shock protein [Lactococcus allomyrinae]
MKQGTVWFNITKSYGFIITDDGKDAFVYFSGFRFDSSRRLDEGQKVTFDIANSSQGPYASNIIKR